MKSFIEFLEEASAPFDIKPSPGTKAIDSSFVIHPASESNMGSTSFILQVNPNGYKEFLWLVQESSYASKNKKWKFSPAQNVDRGVEVSNLTKKPLTFGDFKKEMGTTFKKYGLLDSVSLYTVKSR